MLTFGSIAVNRHSDLLPLATRAHDEWGRWIFRGHREECWHLESSLERSLGKLGFAITEGFWAEGILLREFQRAYSLYSTGPTPSSDLEWLAIMQHYGCPTRLLDWTYSFWAALFFALEDAKPDVPAAVWAMDPDWWRARALATFPDDLRALLDRRESKSPAAMAQVFGRRRGVVWPANPFRLNERLAVQQGVFLACGDPCLPFEDGLVGTAGGLDSTPYLVKIVLTLSRDDLNRSMADLQRMNLTRASLYPGLVGYSQSLPWRLTMRARYVGVDREDGFGAFAG